MQTTGIFSTHRFEIPYHKNNEPIYLIPFGDIHRGAPLCHEEKWKQFLEWAKKKERAYFLGMGDYQDLASASERLILNDKKLHESTQVTIENLYKRLTDKLGKEIEFMKGRCIGLLEGNHYGNLSNGTTTTQRLADLLNTKYLGVSSFIRLQFKQTNKHSGSWKTIDVWAHHGKGAARLVGGSINRVQQMAESAEADIYLMGHDHRRGVNTISRLRLNNAGGGKLKLSHRKILLARTGSFLKGYVEGQPSYVADGAMNPTDLGVIKIELTPRREQLNHETDEWIDIHASI